MKAPGFVQRILGAPAESREASLSDLLAQRDGRFGASNYSGVYVNHESALQNAAVYACIRLLVDTISTLPVDAVRKRGDIREPLAEQPRVVTSPSAILTRPEFIGQLVHSAATRGNAYGVVVDRDAMGFATQVELRSASDVLVTRVGKTGPPIYRFDNRVVPNEDVLHVRGLMAPGAVVGLSAVDIARNAIGLGLAAEKYGTQWFGDGAHPSAVLESEQKIPDENTANVIKRRFMNAVRGREPVVLGHGLKYTSVQSEPEKSQLHETQRWAVEQACRFFGVPPEMIGAASSGSSVTYANREQRALDFVTFGLTPWLVRIEQPWSALLPRGQFVRFNVDALLRSDTKARYESHAIAVRTGWRSINEIRALEDERPIPEGDRYLWPPFTAKQEKPTEDE